MSRTLRRRLSGFFAASHSRRRTSRSRGPIWSLESLEDRVMLSVTPATGGSAISADTTGVSFTTLTGPAYDGVDIPTGTIVLNAPAGFVFDTAPGPWAGSDRLARQRLGPGRRRLDHVGHEPRRSRSR